MLQSMTGYGMGRASNDYFTAVVELKSLNSKFLEVQMRMPPGYFEQEIIIKNLTSQKLQRGKVTLVLAVEIKDTNKVKTHVKIRYDVVRNYFLELKKLNDEFGLQDKISLSSLLNLPGALEEGSEPIDPDEWEIANQAVNFALENLVNDRIREGKAIATSMTESIKRIENCIQEISSYEVRRIETIRQRLFQSLSELALTSPINEDRLQQEVLYYIEKYDINEEKVRIASHISHFYKSLQENESQGRKLVFIVQELWREVNTLGVKSYDPDIQIRVVIMKEELEKIKELLMNVL